METELSRHGLYHTHIYIYYESKRQGKKDMIIRLLSENIQSFFMIDDSPNVSGLIISRWNQSDISEKELIGCVDMRLKSLIFDTQSEFCSEMIPRLVIQGTIES